MVVVLQTVGLLPEPHRSEWCVDGADVVVNGSLIGAAGAFVREGVVVVAVVAAADADFDDGAVVDDDDVPVAPI